MDVILGTVVQLGYLRLKGLESYVMDCLSFSGHSLYAKHLETVTLRLF